MIKFIEIEAKSILQKYKFRDDLFWNRYGVNPYRGCQFACNYCDAITEKYLVHESYKDFSRIIYVKKNAPEILGKEVKKLKPDVVAMSGVTDPYQPAEKRYELSRKMLEILAEHRFPVHIITKSDLVLRDVDLLREIAKQTWCTVSLTIITFNKKLLPYLEPFAPSPERRLDAVDKLNEEGIQAGVDFTPIVPYLLDGPENIEEVIKRASECTQYILIGAAMTLRSNQRIRFFGLLKTNLLISFLIPIAIIDFISFTRFGRWTPNWKLIENKTFAKRLSVCMPIPGFSGLYQITGIGDMFVFALIVGATLKIWGIHVAWMAISAIIVGQIPNIIGMLSFKNKPWYRGIPATSFPVLIFVTIVLGYSL